MIGILVDIYLSMLVTRWFLDVTPLHVAPAVRAFLHNATEPYISQVRRHLTPSWNGKDVTFLAAVCLLIGARVILAALGI